MHDFVVAAAMAAAMLATVRRCGGLAGVARVVGAGVGRTEPACGPCLVEALLDGALMGRAVPGVPAVDVKLGLVAAGAVAGVLLAVVRAGLLAIDAALEAALVREAEITAGRGDLAAAVP